MTRGESIYVLVIERCWLVTCVVVVAQGLDDSPPLWLRFALFCLYSSSKEKAGFIAGKHIKASSKWWFQSSSRRNWKGDESTIEKNEKE